MSAQGATVILADRNLDAAALIAVSLPGALAQPLDVADEAGWRSVAERVGSRFGRLDVLVNNAGVEISKPIAEMSFAEWREVMAVNVDGAFLGCREMLPLLRISGGMRKAGAALINIGSVAALIGYPNQVGYNASKAATGHLARSLAVEWGRAGYNIRANAIHPGPTRTPMVEDYVAAAAARDGAQEEDIWRATAALNPLNRIGRAEDISHAAVFLASDEAAFINGADLVVDGGMVVQ